MAAEHPSEGRRKRLQVTELGFEVMRVAELETFEKQLGKLVGVPAARFDTRLNHSGSG